jgi:hypothetical protein
VSSSITKNDFFKCEISEEKHASSSIGLITIDQDEIGVHFQREDDYFSEKTTKGLIKNHLEKDREDLKNEYLCAESLSNLNLKAISPGKISIRDNSKNQNKIIKPPKPTTKKTYKYPSPMAKNSLIPPRSYDKTKKKSDVT